MMNYNLNPFYNDTLYLTPSEYQYYRREAERRRQEELRQEAIRKRLMRERREREEQIRRERELAQLRAQQRGYKIVRDSDGYLYRVPVHEQAKKAQPSYRVVRGQDGYLYRVPNYEQPTRSTNQSKMPYQVVRSPDGMLYRVENKEPEYDFVRGSDGLIYRVPRTESPMEEEPDYCETKQTDAPIERPVEKGPSRFAPITKTNESGIDIAKDPKPMDTEEQPEINIKISHAPKRRKSKKRISVIVEDASDSECEDDLDSAIRQRVPSPGESWMEPVDIPENVLKSISKH